MSHELVEGTSKLFSSNFTYHKLRRLFEICRLDGFMSMTVLYTCLSVWGSHCEPIYIAYQQFYKFVCLCVPFKSF